MIQIDMQMPENCRMCPVCSEYDICLIPVDGKGFGEQNVSEFIDSRPEWCPLKEQEAVEPQDAEMLIIHNGGAEEYVKDIESIVLLAHKDYDIIYCGTFGRSVK